MKIESEKWRYIIAELQKINTTDSIRLSKVAIEFANWIEENVPEEFIIEANVYFNDENESDLLAVISEVSSCPPCRYAKRKCQSVVYNCPCCDFGKRFGQCQIYGSLFYQFNTGVQELLSLNVTSQIRWQW